MNRNINRMIKAGTGCIIALALFSCNTFKSNDNQKPEYKIIDQYRTTEDPDFYKIELSFPFFTSDNEIQREKLEILNEEITAFLDTAAQYYWGIAPKEVRTIKDETETEGIFELNNTYEILDTLPGFISLKMETYSYALGAHGFTALHTYNYDIDEEKLLKITDLIDLSAPDNERLLNQLLQKNFDNPGDCFDGQPTAGKNFRLFALIGEEVHFYYEAYELGAYYCGIGRVVITVDELKTAGLWKWKNE
jgi:hypothetical protein